MSNPKLQRAPSGLGKSGKALWRSIVSNYDLEVHERLLLSEACRVADRLDAMAEVLTAESLTVINSRGDSVVNPLVVEQRMLSAAFAKLIASLRLPNDDVSDSRPQRRGGARGSYGLHSVEGGGAQ